MQSRNKREGWYAGWYGDETMKHKYCRTFMRGGSLRGFFSQPCVKAMRASIKRINKKRAKKNTSIWHTYW